MAKKLERLEKKAGENSNNGHTGEMSSDEDESDDNSEEENANYNELDDFSIDSVQNDSVDGGGALNGHRFSSNDSKDSYCTCSCHNSSSAHPTFNNHSFIVNNSTNQTNNSANQTNNSDSTTAFGRDVAVQTLSTGDIVITKVFFPEKS